MANYDVSIKIAIAGAKELDRVNKQTEKLRSSINAVNKTAEFSGKKPVKNFNNLSQSVQEARDTLNEAAIGTKEFNQAVKNLITVENKFNRAQKNKNRALKVETIRRKEGLTLQQAKNKISQQELELENKLANAKARTAIKERNKRFGQTVSSAAIGGAFPLLFGQTGAAAIGGGLGGAAGGLIGGQFGFALSIVGTAAGSAIEKVDNFNLSVAKLNGQLKILGFDSQFTGREINQLANSLKITKEEAFELAGAFSRFGKERGKLLAETIGSDTGGLFAIANVKDQSTALAAIETISKNITFEKQAELIASLQTNTASQIQLKLQEILLEAKFEERKALIEEIGIRERIFKLVGKTALLISEGRMSDIESPEDRVKRELKELEERFNKLRQIFDGVIGSIQSIQLETDNLQFSSTKTLEGLQQEMKKLMNPMQQIVNLSDAMATSFEDSFKGIIKGTMTVADAFRNMFNRIADHFLDMAAKMIANQFQQGILGLFSNLFSFNAFSSVGDPALTGAFSGPVTSAPLITEGVFNTGFDTSLIGAGALNFANGGRPPVGRASIVGERGAELFVPDRAGTIIPNHELGGMGGVTNNIVVNVDASGSSVEGDEDEGRALGIALSAAIETELIKQKRPGGLLA